jgi:transmembrane sensor
MTENPPSPSEDRRHIDLAAADWLVRRDRGLTPAEQDEFFQWLAADARHGEWFARHDQTWNKLDGLTQWRPEHSTEPNPDLLAPSRKPSSGRSLLPLAAAAAIVLGAFIWRLWSSVPPVAIASEVGYQSRVLDDGSVVELNRGATVVVKFTAAERHVHLERGEASFKVAKNPNRPFIVQAGGVSVRAVGTAFDVRLGTASVEVLVTEGRVRVGATTATPSQAVADIPELAAGQRAVVSLTTQQPAQVSAVSAEEIARLLRWQPKLLEFSSAPLSDVVADFNRYNRVQLVIAEPALASVPIVASFRSDNIDGFVRLLELTMGVRAQRHDDTITLTRAR